MFADLPLDAPDDLAGWLVAIGAFLALFSFLLPWVPREGIVFGTQGDNSYFGRWGLANPSYLLLLLAAAVQLWLTLVPSRLRPWLRAGVIPIALGGIFLGFTFAYFTAPFGGGPGVTVLFVGATGLAVGGAFALRPDRHQEDGPPV